MGQTTRTEFAQWLREQLRSKGWMVSDFAEQVGVRPAAVYRWTAGQRAPTDAQVDKIALALRIEPPEVWEALSRSGVTPAPPSFSSRPPSESKPPARATAEPTERAFASWLRGALEERGWSTGFLARKLDLDPVTVRSWLVGLREPATVQFPRIASAFDVDVETIRNLLASTE